MENYIVAGILFAISLIAFILSIRSFRGKGFLLNNAYLYASKQERETMDTKPYYQQSGVVFLLISLIFFANALSVLIEGIWVSIAVAILLISIVVYAVVSTIKIERNKHRQQ